MIAATIAYLISQSHSDWLSGESVEVIAVFAVYFPWFIYLVCIHSMPSVRYVIHYTLQVSKTINTKQQNMPHSGVYTKMWKRRRCVYTTIWMHVYMDRLMMRCWSCFAFFCQCQSIYFVLVLTFVTSLTSNNWNWWRHLLRRRWNSLSVCMYT